MNKMTKILALVLALMMVIPMLAACKRTESGGNATPEPGTTEKPGDVEDSAEPSDGDDTYTYNLSMQASPTNWNPHTWEMNADSEIMSYLEMGFVDPIMAEDGVNYRWEYEMAESMTDITATYADREKWLTPDKDGNLPTANYIYEIKLNPNAKWQDGTPINADTYMYSSERLICTEMKNYRAGTFITGDTAFANGYNYFHNDQAGKNMYEPYVVDGGNGKPYEYNENMVAEEFGISLTEECYWFDGSMLDYYNDLVDQEGQEVADACFTTPDGVNLITYLQDHGADNYYIPVTDEIQKIIEDLVNDIENPLFTGVDENKNPITYPESWKELIGVKVGTWEKTDFSDVGIQKVDDYTIIYILAQPLTDFYFKSSMTSNWIVHKETYEAGYEQVEDLLSTNYGTSVDTYMAYGPYKLVSFEPNKQFKLTRNENWYGWTDGKHEGQFQTTDVVYDIIPEHSSEMLSFESGKLDEVSLSADDMNKYRASTSLLKTDETYTQRFVFATDINKLKALEEEAGDGANKRIISYKDFRKAISLSMNRAEFCTQGTAAFKPSFALLNSLYYYDIEKDNESIYRNTDAAKDAVCRLYGIEYGPGTAYADVSEAYANINGYDVDEARTLFEAAADAAIADGNYTEGQAININAYVTMSDSLSSEYTKQNELMNNYVAEATKGTKLEGLVTFKFMATQSNRYDDVANGRIEMIAGAWGGAAFWPQNALGCYTNPDVMSGQPIHETCGWDPTKEEVTMNIGGKDYTYTFADWDRALRNPSNPNYLKGLLAGDQEAYLQVMANLEEAILETYQCIPYASHTTVSMFSDQIQYATLEYNIMYGYGGIRFMTYNYNDAEWDAYVAKNGGVIDYTD